MSSISMAALFLVTLRSPYSFQLVGYQQSKSSQAKACLGTQRQKHLLREEGQVIAAARTVADLTSKLKWETRWLHLQPFGLEGQAEVHTLPSPGWGRLLRSWPSACTQLWLHSLSPPQMSWCLLWNQEGWGDRGILGNQRGIQSSLILGIPSARTSRGLLRCLVFWLHHMFLLIYLQRD